MENEEPGLARVFHRMRNGTCELKRHSLRLPGLSKPMSLFTALSGRFAVNFCRMNFAPVFVCVDGNDTWCFIQVG